MNYDIVDRDAELGQLRKIADTPPGLVIMRGRRRIGKSHLLRAAFSGERVVTIQADERPERQQLQAIADEVARVVMGAPGLRFVTWEEALTFLAVLAADRSLIVVLDEFQHLCASQRSLPSIIQRHWDEWDRRRVPITLVLCGSALTFMEGLLPAEAPLAGRAGLRPLITAMGYREAAGFAPPGSSPQALIQRYAVLGGTPQYQLWAGHRDIGTTIRDVILTKGAPLFDEPMQLLRSEDGIRDPGRYLGVLTAIGAGRTQLNEIAQHTGYDPSNIVKTLHRLQELDYVELREPVVLDRARRSRPYWRLADPFFRFWFQFVFPHRSRLEWGLVDEVADDLRQVLDVHCGTVFEDVCRAWLVQRSGLDEMRGFRRVGAWWRGSPAAEIDIAVVDKTRYTLLGSCKWHRRPVGVSVLEELQDQRAMLGAKAARARLVVFAREGFSDESRSHAERDGSLLVTARDLFSSTRSIELGA